MFPEYFQVVYEDKFPGRYKEASARHDVRRNGGKTLSDQIEYMRKQIEIAPTWAA